MFTLKLVIRNVLALLPGTEKRIVTFALKIGSVQKLLCTSPCNIDVSTHFNRFCLDCRPSCGKANCNLGSYDMATLRRS
jgi:hypothetical protein